MKIYKVVFLPTGQSLDVAEGTIITKAMKDAGIAFDFFCDREKGCGKCRIRVLEGVVKSHDDEREFLSDQDISEGIHLACFTEVHSNVSVDILQVNSDDHRILLSSEKGMVRIEPHVSKRYIEVEKASIDNYQSDWRRLIASLFQDLDEYATAFDGHLSILHKLPELLRVSNNRLTAVTYGSEILGIEQQDTSQTLLGMAFDIGTTTIVGYLMDLYTGKELSVVSILNPQIKYGADAITRMNYANEEEKGLEILHVTVIRTINKLIKEAAEKAGISSNDIYTITVAGNTCMHHLFLGLSPRYSSQEPYTPTISEPIVLNASSLNIRINNIGKVLVLSNIAGFVGADTTASLLAAEMDSSEYIKLMIDIGTNGEIVLGSKHRLITCSSTSGHAFEGVQISSGMRGTVGAIDHVKFGEKLEYSVIGRGKPQGICGSGLLDVVAGLINIGIIDEMGKLLSPERITNPAAKGFKKNIIQHEGIEAFLLVDEDSTCHGRPILVTQQDIRELQLAKGAMLTGIKILMNKYGIDFSDIKEVLLAGAFGNYLDPRNACIIGLIPKELEYKIKTIGNAAGTGAKLALISRSRYKRAADISNLVEYVELESYPEFSSIFARSTYFR